MGGAPQHGGPELCLAMLYLLQWHRYPQEKKKDGSSSSAEKSPPVWAMQKTGLISRDNRRKRAWHFKLSLRMDIGVFWEKMIGECKSSPSALLRKTESTILFVSELWVLQWEALQGKFHKILKSLWNTRTWVPWWRGCFFMPLIQDINLAKRSRRGQDNFVPHGEEN